MRNLWITFLLIIATLPVTAGAQQAGRLIRLDPALDEILPPGTKVEKLAENFLNTEGPVWVPKGGYLIFSDFANNVINKWDPKDRKVSTYLEQPSKGDKPEFMKEQANRARNPTSKVLGSNGITLDHQGRVVYASMSDRQIVRLEPDGKRTVLANQYEGKPLDPNDLVYNSNESLYFTSSPNVYMLKGGKLQSLSTQPIVTGPNGLAFSPDERHLYVTDTGKLIIARYEVQPDGAVAKGEVFIDMNAGQEPCPRPCPLGYPDGMKVDQKGNVYSGGPGGLWIMSAEGKHLGTVLFSEKGVDPWSTAGVSNLNWGDADGKGLYLTLRTALYRIRLGVPGTRP